MKVTFLLCAIVLAFTSVVFDPAPAAACGGWWDPCCKWWEPSTCPAPLKQRAKDAAHDGANYLGQAKGFFGAFSLATCGAAALGAPALAMGPACVGGMAGGFASDMFKDVFDQASRDPWDDLWWQDYEGGAWPSAESLGVGYTGYYWVDNLIGDVQAALYFSDFTYVTANRLNTCYQVLGLDGPLDTCARQKARVDWGFYMLGWYTRDSVGNLRAIADDLEQGGGDGNLISVLRDVANVNDWVGSEFMQ